MAGKSTYLRTVCLIQILAQMGCQVPADKAQVAPMNRIFSRCGHNDSLLRGLSGFGMEMHEMSAILQNANRQTLIVVDELARSGLFIYLFWCRHLINGNLGTSTEEGIAMCCSICEKLLLLGSYVFFATHFLDLAAMEFNYPSMQK